MFWELWTLLRPGFFFFFCVCDESLSLSFKVHTETATSTMITSSSKRTLFTTPEATLVTSVYKNGDFVHKRDEPYCSKIKFTKIKNSQWIIILFLDDSTSKTVFMLSLSSPQPYREQPLHSKNKQQRAEALGEHSREWMIFAFT